MAQQRREFLKKSILIIGSTFVLPKLLCASQFSEFHRSEAGANGDTAALIFNPDAIIDLHCHPSLKMYLWDKRIWKRHLFRSHGENTFHQQIDTHELSFGNVKGIVAAHYLVEKGIETRWTLVKFIWPFLNKIFFSEANKIEHEDYSYFTQINVMINTLEAQVYIANKKQHLFQFFIARNFEEFERASKAPGIIAIAHAIEGAHALGTNFARSQEKTKKKLEYLQKKSGVTFNGDIRKTAVLEGEGKMILKGTDQALLYIRNLESLFSRGVCLMTLSHFFENDISFPVEGISPKGKKFPGFRWFYDPDKDNQGLTIIGTSVLRRMLEIGMIVDLTHSTPAVRQDVFAIRDDVNKARKANGKIARPLVFTHVGSQEVFTRHDNGKYPNYRFYDISKEEVCQVCKDGGVVGVIPEIFFLAGSDKVPEIEGQTIGDFDLGIPYLIETIKVLNGYTRDKNYRNIALGTDFDGLADNPKDLYLSNQSGGLIKAMKADPELNQADYVARITHLNALELLRNGWGNGPV